MKYILKAPLLIMSFIIIFIIGCFVGYNISDNFPLLYMSKLTQIPARYILLILIVFTNNLVFNQLNCNAIILRKKSLFNSLLNFMKIEVIVLLLLFICLHLPIIFLNTKEFFSNSYLIIKVIINGVIVSLLLLNIIKIVDIKIKNRTVASGFVLAIFCIADILLGHFNFFIINNEIFDFSYIFAFPYIYKNYYAFASILVVIIVILTALFVFLGIKNDYFLGSTLDEEN